MFKKRKVIVFQVRKKIDISRDILPREKFKWMVFVLEGDFDLWSSWVGLGWVETQVQVFSGKREERKKIQREV